MTPEILLNFILTGLPVILGAIIGYITNAIAIKMLFRPLTKKTIFGITVPFTPGIIPKQRTELAESIGRMVSEKLLTETAVKDQLESQKFQNGLLKSISNSIDDLIEKPMSSLKDKDLRLFYNSLDGILAGTLNRFFNSEQFSLSIENLLKFFIESVSEKNIKELFSPGDVKQLFKNTVIPFLTGEKTKEKLAELISEWLLKNKNTNTKVGKILPDELKSHIIPSLKYSLPGFFRYFLNWLSEPDIHRELEEKGVLILKSIINKLSIFQKLFISMGQYDTTLETEMPSIIDDIIAYVSEGLENEETIDSILKVIENTLNDLLEKDFGEFLEIIDMEISEIAESVKSRFPDILKNETLKNKFSGVFDDFYKQNQDKSLAEFSETVLKIKVEDLSRYFTEQLVVYLQGKKASDSISEKILKFVSGFLNERNSILIKDFFNITEAKKNNIVIFIKDRIIGILYEKLPDLIESIDIKELVVKKINNLEMIQVEKLLLMVIQRHLKWINLFGALLGACIGLSQVIINNIIR